MYRTYCRWIAGANMSHVVIILGQQSAIEGRLLLCRTAQ